MFRRNHRKALNLLFGAADFPPIEGGISTHIFELSKNLFSQGDNITVIAPPLAKSQKQQPEISFKVVRHKQIYLECP